MSELGEGVCVPVDGPPPKDDERERVKIRVTLSFDGTANNRVNTMVRQLAERPLGPSPTDAAKKEKAAAVTIHDAHGGSGTSYANDLSNVARLEKHFKQNAAGYDHYISVYTEGIGTFSFGGDSLASKALGTGSAGIVAKVDKSLLVAISEILSKVPAKTIIEKLSVDTTGFSRGAAAARNCVHRILKGDGSKQSLKKRLEGFGRTVEQVEVTAVGLFDTVSSHGVRHANDVADLKLDAIRDAKAVLQLAAAEEYRENFSLTNIDSAGGKGRQVYLPGAHSDVGGGYLDGDSESKALVTGSRSRHVAAFLRERGWYTDGELSCSSVHTMDGDFEYVEVARKGISQQYSFIPLRIMADFFVQQGLSVESKLYRLYKPDGVPPAIVSRIDALAKGTGSSSPSTWEGVGGGLADLRHRFLHISFSDDIGMGVRSVNEGTFFKPKIRPYRLVYRG